MKHGCDFREETYEDGSVPCERAGFVDCTKPWDTATRAVVSYIGHATSFHVSISPSFIILVSYNAM